MTHSAEIQAWLSGRLPTEWFQGPPEVVVDREEITVVGRLTPVELQGEAGPAERVAAARGLASRFREDTREARMAIARELEHQADRKVAWGVEVDGERFVYTNLAVPVMTRLRQPERAVLDTLVDSGVARSRAEALAWCVKLVGRHSDDWLAQLRTAMADVERIRSAGPVN